MALKKKKTKKLYQKEVRLLKLKTHIALTTLKRMIGITYSLLVFIPLPGYYKKLSIPHLSYVGKIKT